MKRLIVLFMLTAMFMFGQTITNSAHDFSNLAWNAEGEVCNTCHAPHNGSSVDGPLWNHSTTITVFNLYTSSTLDATQSQPTGTSKLCLSCHDGTVAVDNYGGVTTGTNFVGGTKNLGSDLSNDHPISFIYDGALATTDAGLFNPVTQNSGLGSTIDVDMLFGNSMECSSCHDVHNSTGEANLLVMNNASSALCLTCHNK